MEKTASKGNIRPGIGDSIVESVLVIAEDTVWVVLAEEIHSREEVCVECFSLPR